MVGYTFDLCFVHPKRHSFSAYLLQPFHLLPTYETLSLTSSLLFIRSWINQRPWPLPKAQYINLGPYPYNNNNKKKKKKKKKKMNQTTLVNQAA